MTPKETLAAIFEH